MAVAQFTLWGTQCQWLIARCILDSILFAPYLSQGKNPVQRLLHRLLSDCAVG